MVLEPGQLWEGFESGMKLSIDLGVWSKSPAPPWAPGAGTGSQHEPFKKNRNLFCVSKWRTRLDKK